MADIMELPGMFLQSLSDALFSNLLNEAMAKTILGIIAAIIIVLIGWVLAKIVKQVIIKILQSTKVDQWIDEQNLTAAIGGKEVSALVGSLTKWYIIGIFLAQAVDWIELKIFSTFLQRLFVFSETPGAPIPIFFALLGGIVVMATGLLVARYARNKVEATTFKMKTLAGLSAEGIILIFFGMFALTVIAGPEIALVIVDLLRLFLTPFITAFAYMLAFVVGISLLVNNKVELKKISDEFKKALK